MARGIIRRIRAATPGAGFMSCTRETGRGAMAAAPSPHSPTARFDRRLFVDRGDVFEGERRYTLGKHAGTIRLLQYFNHTHAGSYADAIRLGEQTGTTPSVD